MKATVLRECGYEEALRGMAYSYKDSAIDPAAWWEGQYEKAQKRAKILSHRSGGHNKFLETIQLWIDVQGTRAWWSEMDTYRVGITKQSESTMHTLSRRPPVAEDFEEGTHPRIIQTFTELWPEIKDDINALKKALPEGFLQRRIINLNYKQLQNIYYQRHDHRLLAWREMLSQVLSQIEHPEFIVKE